MSKFDRVRNIFMDGPRSKKFCEVRNSQPRFPLEKSTQNWNKEAPNMNDIDSGVSVASAFGEAMGVTFEAELPYSLRKPNT